MKTMKHATLPISVVIPTFNRASSIIAALNSVTTQTPAPAEVIVVDDGSTDETADVVAQIDNKSVRYLRQENAGANAARNLGIKESVQPFVAFHDSDDLWLPGKLAVQWPALEQGDAKASFGRFLRVSTSHVKFLPFSKSSTYNEPHARTSALTKNLLSTQTLIIEKETLNKIGGFDPALPRFQDWDLFLRLAKDVPFRFHLEPLVLAFDGDDNITRNYDAGIAARRYFLEKYREDFACRPTAQLKARWELFIRIALRKLSHGLGGRVG